MNGLFFVAAYIIGGIILAYRRSSLRDAAVASGALLLVFLIFGPDNWGGTLILAVTAGLLTALSMEDLRRGYITAPLFRWYRRVLPPLSETEREAIDAGTVWWDGELFTGRPDWKKLMSAGAPRLSDEEQAFLDGPVEDLCAMVDSWKLSHELAGIPPHIESFIKEKGFLGMIIPKEYGGLDLSAVAQSHVLTRVLSIGSMVGNYIMVPNSLGPGELLMKYGTEEQKNHYLPRLARGEDIPCFALTAPLAGSDATAIPDTGVVCKGTWEGKEITGMRLTFDKRYITLAPVATLVGLAFRLKDPDHLIGEVDDYGITCALIPHDTPGLEIGSRHSPVGQPFYNGPVRGTDVFVPLEYIIGGQEMAGKGWRMLVNCLSAGRAISLPSASNCIAKSATAATGAYARIRRQFGVYIGQFEGIQKPLARMAGLTYIIDAARLHTAQAVAMGSKPAVPSAILKYHCTEMARRVINDAFDIHGGKAVMKGPGNYLAPAYEGIPVAITVEGANIMTRSLMIFGQGAIRSHPFVLREMELARAEDSDETLKEFDALLFDHIGLTYNNAARAFIYAFTGARNLKVPVNGPMRRYCQQITRLAAAFEVVADAAMLTMQASLKRREMISARLGDLLSALFLASMVVKQFQDSGAPEDDLPVARWALDTLLADYQDAMHELLRNLPSRLVAWKLRWVVFPLGRHFERPSDQTERQVAGLVLRSGDTRRRLIDGIYLTPNDNNPVGRLNELITEAEQVEPLERRMRDAVKAGTIAPLMGRELIDAAREAGVITDAEAARLREYDARIMDVINVDEFGFDALGHRPASDGGKRQPAGAETVAEPVE